MQQQYSAEGKKIQRALLTALLALIIFPLIYGFGLSPAKSTIYCAPAVSQDIRVVNVMHEEGDVTLVVPEAFREWVTITPALAHLTPADETAVFHITITMPPSMAPGPHSIPVMLVPSTEGEKGIGAQSNIISEIIIFVPYHGSFIEASLEILPEKDSARISAPIKNLGDEATSVQGTLSIADKDGNINIPLREQFPLLLPGTTQTMTFHPLLNKGRYTLNLSLISDHQKMHLSQDFVVGIKAIDIQDLQLLGYSGEHIQRFQITAYNEYGDSLNDIEGDVRIEEDGKAVGETKIPPFSLKLDEREQVPFFVEAELIPGHSYIIAINLRWEGGSSGKRFPLNIGKEAAKPDLRGLILILLLIAIEIIRISIPRKHVS